MSKLLDKFGPLIFVFGMLGLVILCASITNSLSEPGDVNESGSNIRKILLERQLSNIENDQLTEGELVLTLEAWRSTDTKVTLVVNGGVRFQSTSTFKVQAGGQKITIEHLPLQESDVRTLRFPFLVDPEVTYSGTYIATAEIFEWQPIGAQSVESRTVALHVYADPNGSILLSEATDLEARYPFLWQDLRSGNQEMALLLEETPQPQSGIAWLKLQSRKDGFQPTIEVLMSDNGAIQFTESSASSIVTLLTPFSVRIAPGTLDDDGTRYVPLPFQINPNAVDGRYTFQVTVFTFEGKEIDQAPIQLQINSSSLSAPPKWLSLVSE